MTKALRLIILPLVLVAGLFASPARATDLTDAFENALIDFLFRGQTLTIGSSTATWSAAPELYIALHTAACSDSSAGTEVTGGSYARVRVPSSGAPTLSNAWSNTNSSSGTTASSGTSGTTANLNAVTFPTATADWGTATHFSFMTASSGGTQLICRALTASRNITNGSTASFAAGGLTVQIDN